MRVFILTLLLAIGIYAKPLEVGSILPTITLPDQFGKSHTVDKNISKIIITFDKKSSVLANKFISLKKDSANYLDENNMAFIANITDMPALITKLFAMPKMKKYKHTILLINDDENDMFLSKKRSITIYHIKDEKIKDITFVKTIEELNATVQN